MTAQALVSAIDGMTNESSGDELFSELETQEYKEAFELFDKVSASKSQLCLLSIVCPCELGPEIKLARGLVTFVPAVAYHFCLSFPATISQPHTSTICRPQ